MVNAALISQAAMEIPGVGDKRESPAGGMAGPHEA
jgi:hypothetical protein